MKRGEIWWAQLRPPAGQRPVALVSREEAYRIRKLIVVAPVTTHVRGIPVEVPIGVNEGLRKQSVINCDVLDTISKQRLLHRVGELGPAKLAELDGALKLALGLD